MGTFHHRVKSDSFDWLTETGTVDPVTTETVIASIVLKELTKYRELEVILSCSRECRARIVLVSDVGGTDTETTIVSGIRTQSGNSTFQGSYSTIGKFSTTTGVQELRILAQVLTPASGVRVDATIGIREILGL